MNNSRKGIIACAVLVAVFIIGFLFYIFRPIKNAEVTTEDQYVGFSGIAKSNPFLAGERFLKHYKFKSSSVLRYNRAMLPQINMLIIPLSAIPHEDTELVYLEEWLDQGNILLTGNLNNIPITGDSLPQRLRSMIGLRAQTPLDDSYEEEFSIEILNSDIKGLMNAKHEVKCIRSVNIVAGTTDDAMFYEHEGVIFFNDLSIITNEFIRKQEHATILYELCKLKGVSDIVFINNIQSLTMFEWLWRNAKLPMGIFAVCLLAFILKYMKRFGPVCPEESLDRRQLLEHISASGQYFWRQKHQAPLINKAKDELLDVVMVKHPYLKNLNKGNLYQELSEMTGIESSKIIRAFDSKPTNEEEFLNTVVTLKSVRQHL